jgi:hypothetical protein
MGGYCSVPRVPSASAARKRLRPVSARCRPHHKRLIVNHLHLREVPFVTSTFSNLNSGRGWQSARDGVDDEVQKTGGARSSAHARRLGLFSCHPFRRPTAKR